MKGVYIDQAKEDVAQLQQFAGSLGFQHKLMPWDLNYYMLLRHNHLYKSVNLTALV